MRRAKVGSSCDGSRRLKKVRFGSTPETAALAEISSPLARTRLATAPSLTRMWRTSASVRISAPAWRADSASARVNEPSPPCGKEAETTGWGSAAARRRRTAGGAAGAGHEKIAEICGRRRIDGWRRGREELVQNREEMFERFGELSIFRSIFGGEAGDAAGGFGVVVVEKEGFAVGRRREEPRGGMHDVALEL